MFDQTTTLSQLLASFVSGVATVPMVQFLLKYLPDTLSKTKKRILAVAVSFALGLGALGLSIFLGYVSQPSGVSGWFDAAWPVCFAAFGASQMVLSGIQSAGLMKKPVMKPEILPLRN